MAVFLIPYEYNELIHLEGVITVLKVADISDEDRVESLKAWLERVGGKLENWMVDWMLGPPESPELELEEEVEGGEIK